MVVLAAWVASAAWGAEPPGSLAEADAAGRRAVEVARPPSAPKVVLAGGTVMTAAGDVFSPGYVVLEGGKIAAVGSGDAPDTGGAAVIDVRGRFVTPGLIDTHSHLGVYPSPGGRADSDGNEATAPTTPGVWAEHSVWPQDPGFLDALAGGVTAMQILPGSANLIGGRGVVVHNLPGRGSRVMRLEGAPETLKMACGENPKRVYGDRGGPSTRMGNLRGQRQAFLDAAAYQREWTEYAKKRADYDAKKADAEAWTGPAKKRPAAPDEPKPPGRDLAKETLVGVLEGRVLPQVHCYRADDMLSFLQLADEVGFEVRGFHHALEAYKIRDVLAAEGVSVSTWADWWGFKEEAYDGIPENAAMVSDAGGRAVIHSDSPVGIQRLNQEAGKAAWSGRHAGLQVSDDAALRWVTANPAWTLGIDGQVGALRPGLRADVVVWSEHPFSVYAAADLVFIDGALRYDRARPPVWSDFETGREGAR